MRVCALDIGTVTTRVLVAEVTAAGRLTELLRRSTITHLGEGLSVGGTLSGAAIERVGATVAGYLAAARELGAERTVAVATSAARDAANAGELSARMEAVGVTPEVIAGEREARLSFLGATYDLDGEDILVADPGGGSTELIYGDAREEGIEIAAARSVDVGARRITELFLRHDPPTSAEVDAARGWAADGLRPFFAALRERPRVLVTLAGTATTLVAVEQALDPYDSARVHGFRLSGATVSALLGEFASMPLAERERITGLEPERAPVIIGGTLVVETVMSLSGLDSTIVSEHDILYGIALDTVLGG